MLQTHLNHLNTTSSKPGSMIYIIEHTFILEICASLPILNAYFILFPAVSLSFIKHSLRRTSPNFAALQDCPALFKKHS